MVSYLLDERSKPPFVTPNPPFRSAGTGVKGRKMPPDRRWMPNSQTHVLPCARCDTEPLNDAALFCRRCGAPLPFERVVERVVEYRVSGWKSVPGPIRFAIWVIALPILLSVALWVLLILSAAAS